MEPYRNARLAIRNVAVSISTCRVPQKTSERSTYGLGCKQLSGEQENVMHEKQNMRDPFNLH